MAAFWACLGVPTDAPDRLMEESSPVFTDGGTRYVYSWVGSFRSQERVAADTARLGGDRASDCLAEALTAGLSGPTKPAGVSVGTPHVEVTLGGGPANVVATATATVPTTSPSGAHMTLYWQYVFLSGRTTEAVVGTGTVDAPLAADVRNRAIEAVAQRVAAG